MRVRGDEQRRLPGVWGNFRSCHHGQATGPAHGTRCRREAGVQRRPAHVVAAERRRSEAMAGKDVTLELEDVKAANGEDRCLCGKSTSASSARVACSVPLVYETDSCST